MNYNFDFTKKDCLTLYDNHVTAFYGDENMNKAITDGEGGFFVEGEGLRFSGTTKYLLHHPIPLGGDFFLAADFVMNSGNAIHLFGTEGRNVFLDKDGWFTIGGNSLNTGLSFELGERVSFSCMKMGYDMSFAVGGKHITLKTTMFPVSILTIFPVYQFEGTISRLTISDEAVDLEKARYENMVKRLEDFKEEVREEPAMSVEWAAENVLGIEQKDSGTTINIIPPIIEDQDMEYFRNRLSEALGVPKGVVDSYSGSSVIADEQRFVDSLPSWTPIAGPDVGRVDTPGIMVSVGEESEALTKFYEDNVPNTIETFKKELEDTSVFRGPGVDEWAAMDGNSLRDIATGRISYDNQNQHPYIEYLGRTPEFYAQELSFLKRDLLETQKLIELAGDHPIMSTSLKEKEQELKSRIANLPIDLKIENNMDTKLTEVERNMLSGYEGLSEALAGSGYEMDPDDIKAFIGANALGDIDEKSLTKLLYYALTNMNEYTLGMPGDLSERDFYLMRAKFLTPLFLTFEAAPTGGSEGEEIPRYGFAPNKVYDTFEFGPIDNGNVIADMLLHLLIQEPQVWKNRIVRR